ncbi:hypothetical protein [Streptomyces chattanoogensis]|nr:hypothetical protein [Streptomyces chattanoogensis]
MRNGLGRGPSVWALAVCAYVVLGVPTYQSGAVRFLSPATFHSGPSLPVW